MRLKQISEILYNFYSDGRPDASDQHLDEADIIQMCRMSAAANFRRQYSSSQVMVSGRKVSFSNADSEYYFSSPLLSIKRFLISEPDYNGMRVADMNEFDLYRLPKNTHFSNIYLVNNECGGQKFGNITLVSNGEEKFYLKPKFKGYLFASVVGRTLRTYNVPPCVKKIDVETTYDSDEIDITLDVAFDVSSEVLGLIFKTSDETGEMQIKLREEVKKMEDAK